MSTHVDKLDTLIEQLHAMETTFDDALAVGILLASIKVSELSPVTASIKTLSEESVTWEIVQAHRRSQVNFLLVRVGRTSCIPGECGEVSFRNQREDHPSDEKLLPETDESQHQARPTLGSRHKYSERCIQA